MAVVATVAILPFGVGAGLVACAKIMAGKAGCRNSGGPAARHAAVATGLILLKLLGRKDRSAVFFTNQFDLELVFTWRAVVAAMTVMSFPLLVRGARIAFEASARALKQVATTLGASPLRVFLSITFSARHSWHSLRAACSPFARALGEFGATSLWLAIFRRTTTLSSRL